MTDFLPGTEAIARGLRWEVVESQPVGAQTRVRLRWLGGVFGGAELDILTPFEDVQPLTHEMNPQKAGRLAEWLVYHQAFLLEQALGPNAFLSVQPGRLRIEPYQLVPLMRALRMSRPRLLLADDVGLGKTIQAGLIMAELMARRRAHRILVVTPAGPLMAQWKQEMLERFGLRLDEVNRDALDRIRKGAELGANPFHFLSLAIASMDFLKQDNILNLLERSSYDLVVMDEAHHYGETGADDAKAERLASSQRRKLAETLARRSDALLLLTATPHDGYERSFASLLELLDPSLVDGAGRVKSDTHLTRVVRRLKRHVRITHPETGEAMAFPERQIVPLRTRRFDNALAFLALLKRSTSTTQALAATLEAVHNRFETLATAAEEELDSRKQRRKSLKSLQRKLARFGTLTLDEEAEYEALEIEELAQQLRLLDTETRRGQRQVNRAESIADALAQLRDIAARSPDLKLDTLIAQIRQIRAAEASANILIYTEYVKSLEAVQQRLHNEGFDSILTIQGADDRHSRERVTNRFRTLDGQILVSTDAAAEGLNLHDRCHHLIHLELPWNPNRLEQRNGRIDRYGQWKTPIIRYLYLCGTFEERILARLIAKYERQRNRLRFVPNTLGIGIGSLPEEGLFAALTTETEELSRGDCKNIHFTESDGDADEANETEMRQLLEEVDKSLRRFEQTAKTHRWLGETGAAADEVARNQAATALAVGRKAGDIDLVNFVAQAAQSEGGAVNRGAETISFTLPEMWRYGLEDIPGWNAERGRLQVTTNLNLFSDEKENPVGFLGRAHPVVRRAIEHVRHQALGQSGKLDRRISAAKSPDGQKALLVTFLGRVHSRAGREFERVLAIKIAPDLHPLPLTEPAEWLPQAADALPTKNLWENAFAAWGDEALTLAKTAVEATFGALSRKFEGQYRRQMKQEEREVEVWFRQRVDELLGSTEVSALPLFEGLGEAERPPAERLATFIRQRQPSAKDYIEAEALQQTHQRRIARIKERADLRPGEVNLLGMLMLT
ncbi:MAG: hypothetical protein B6243_13005 [Anaerolineaceae bacterium 4572_5.2]|nr:MAG: hypothetical protein B6243_13005 [Anaerolineaceae bacterium 4572_5.2]